MLCNSEYHKDDPAQTPVISRGLEGDSEPNPGENLEVKRQLESGQTMQVHQSCDPKPSRKSEEKKLPESSQTTEVEQNCKQNPSGNWKEKGQFESSHKFEANVSVQLEEKKLSNQVR